MNQEQARICNSMTSNILSIVRIIRTWLEIIKEVKQFHCRRLLSSGIGYGVGEGGELLNSPLNDFQYSSTLTFSLVPSQISLQRCRVKPLNLNSISWLSWLKSFVHDREILHRSPTRKSQTLRNCSLIQSLCSVDTVLFHASTRLMYAGSVESESGKSHWYGYLKLGPRAGGGPERRIRLLGLSVCLFLL
jgi:hypothetical protein